MLGAGFTGSAVAQADSECGQVPNLSGPAADFSPATATASGSPTPTARPIPSSSPSPTASPTPTTGEPGVYTVTVTRVVDGDTLKIEYENGTADTVRLLGIDTPEVHVENDPTKFEGVPDTVAGQECLRDIGEDASAFMKERLAGATVELRMDDAADTRDSYGRLLAYVYDDDTNLNYVLIDQGYARTYDGTFSQSTRFYDAEDSAQAASEGSGRAATPTPTPAPENSEADLVIAEIHEDAIDNDHENTNDEYIVVRNDGDEPLDLGGWTVRDEADHTYIVPRGVTLDPGATVTLYSGKGSDTDAEQYWESGTAIWNNGGDTILVRDDSGTVIFRREY